MRYKNTDAVPINEERDLVEVVRCKDCRFSEHCYDDVFDCKCPNAPFANDEYAIFCNENDFCSCGERREK